MRTAAAIGLAACAVAAGCGGSSSSDEPRAGTLEALWRAPGEDVGMIAGTQDYSPGRVRVVFLVVDGQGRVVSRPTARVWVARRLDAVPYAETTARLEPIGIPGGETADAEAIFVAHVDVPAPGKYWVLAEPVGGRKIQAVGNLVVKRQADAPAVGEQAVASSTPTLATATLDQLTTSQKPDHELYRVSVAEALRTHEPFVVAFATPEFCTSRTCGPVVDVVSTVRREHADSPVRFIHVEIFKDNDPAKGVNRWVDEWKLPTEPWVFLVDRDGKIVERFEGSVSVRELTDAISAKLR